MNFDEVLNEVRDALERDGRVAYRMLKRRFELDDEDIEDIKAELIDTKRLALDEDGKVLVWAASAQSDNEQVNDVPIEADRRLLTVMFCDIVDSTALSEQFDAEELRDLIRQYQQTCAAVIDRFEGHIAQYLGDGLLVYFGYPVAQEDEAYEAVRSGLEILQNLKEATSITRRLGSPIRVRIGIHTGPVVIGEMGGSGRIERLALGDTPNIAARVQGKARPDEILISETTHRLIEGLFTVEALGAQALKGVTKSFDLFRVIDESVVESPFEVALSTGRLTRFIGQEEELTLLNQHWTQAQNAKGQVIHLSAEPGMGKSRLAQEFKERMSARQARQMTFRCSPYHQSSAFYPVIQVMQRVFQFGTDDASADKLAKVETTLANYELSDPDAVALVSGLLSLPHPDLELSNDRDLRERRQRLIVVLTEWFLEESRRAPVYMIWDDLHWADPSTVDLIEYYLDHVPTSATLALLIYRSNYTPAWKQRGFFRYLSLNRLNDAHVEELVTDIAGNKKIPQSLLEHIKDKTDGIPLYVEELTRMVVESRVLDAVSSDTTERTIAQMQIPMTLQDSLEARLDLCPIGKDIAQWGATLGREFSYAVLRAVVDDELRLKAGIAELLDAELIYRNGSPTVPTFIFKHALLRDTAYESLLIRKRREYHAQIAQVLESDFPQIDETQPELIAHHYTEAGLVDDAIRYWQRAGQFATNRSANQEALGHLQRGLDLLKLVPRTHKHARLELDLQLLLGTLVISSKGNASPEVETIYRRALAICDELGDVAAKAPVYFGLRSYYLAKADLPAEHEIAVALLEAAEAHGDEGALLEAHVALTNSFFYLGVEHKTFEHASAAAQLYDTERHAGHAAIYGLDPGAISHVRLAQTAWMTGLQNKAQIELERALAIIEHVEHPLTKAFTLANFCTVYLGARNYERAAHYANATVEISSQYGFPFYRAWGLVQRGNVLAHDGEIARGLAEIEEGMASVKSGSSHLIYPLFATLYAEALGLAGEPERGLALLPEAVSTIEKSGARYFEGSLYCVKGFLLRQIKLPTEAERAFEQSIAISQHRGIRAQELKAAIAIAELHRSSGKGDELAARLKTLYEGFADEPESADLKDARLLLEAMT